MSNTTAAIIGMCIPIVVVVIVQVFGLYIEPYLIRKREQRKTLKSIRKLPYNKGERVLSKEQQDALRAILSACDELRNSDNPITTEELKEIIESYGK